MAASRLGLGLVVSVAWSVALAGCSEAAVNDSGRGGSGGAGVSGGSGPGSGGSTGGSAAPSGGAGASAGGMSGGGAGSGGVGGGGTPAVIGGSGGGGGGGSSSTGGAGNAGAVPSEGCSKTTTQTLETFVEAKVTAKGFERQYYVRLPGNYDPTRAYPTVVVGAGCGGKGNAGISIQDASKNDAIVIGLSPSSEVAGRDCFMTESPTSPEIDFFDAALAATEAAFCVDKSRVFIEGFSSGSWLTNLIGCARGSVIRGQGNASGGPPPLPTCQGPVATIMVHDTTDNDNKFNLGEQTRDRIRDLNGCTNTTAPWDAAYPECVAYQGCPAAYPLVFCTTTGKGHTENKPFSTEGFWKFWSALPPKP